MAKATHKAEATAPAAVRMGRPTNYTVALADAICVELSENVVSLASICRRPEMPGYSTICQWLDRYPDFAEKYARARDRQADVIAEQTLEIADDMSRDVKLDEDGRPSVDHEHIARSRLRVDTRKWIASKLKPKKYGDKLLHTGGDGEGPIQHALALNYDALTDDELAIFRRLLDKASAPSSAQPVMIEGKVESDGDQ